jgi:hypothetical protein
MATSRKVSIIIILSNICLILSQEKGGNICGRQVKDKAKQRIILVLFSLENLINVLLNWQ